LGKLKALGLLFSERQGKVICYEVSRDRVRYQRHADGDGSDLTLTARGGDGGQF
jgi:hypothetical protein